MHKRNLIEDNKRGENQSFLYFLHEEKKFDVKALDDLCHYIIELDTISLEELRDIHYIENQILRHLVYHFDDNDLSKISNLPFEYWEHIEPFERLMHAAGSAGDVIFGEEEVVARAEQHGLVALKLAGADRGPFRIEHEGAGCVQFATNLFQAVHARFMLGAGAM